MSVAAQFQVIKNFKALFCSCERNMHTIHNVKPHINCSFYFLTATLVTFFFLHVLTNQLNKCSKFGPHVYKIG